MLTGYGHVTRQGLELITVPSFILTIILMGEAVGAYYTVTGLDDEKLDDARVRRELTGEWIGTLISHLLGSTTNTTYAQNIGSRQVTKIGARIVFTASGILLIIFGFIPKIGAFILWIPPSILGVAFLIIYMMLLTTGLLEYFLLWNEKNMIIVDISLSFGLGVSLVPSIAFSSIPIYFRSALISPVVLTASTAILLILILNLIHKWIKKLNNNKKLADLPKRSS
jgi:xanthine permease